MPRSRPAYSSSSAPLSRSNSLASAGTTPMTALAVGGSVHISSPSIRTRPPSGRSRPVIIDSDVVFPAPFGPTSPAREPAAMARLMPAPASFGPKLLRSPVTAIAGSPMVVSSGYPSIINYHYDIRFQRAASAALLARVPGRAPSTSPPRFDGQPTAMPDGPASAFSPPGLPVNRPTPGGACGCGAGVTPGAAR